MFTACIVGRGATRILAMWPRHSGASSLLPLPPASATMMHGPWSPQPACPSGPKRLKGLVRSRPLLRFLAAVYPRSGPVHAASGSANLWVAAGAPWDGPTR